MGIIDTISDYDNKTEAFYRGLDTLLTRANNLLESGFGYEAAIQTIILVEEFLRIQIEFYEELFQTNAFNVRDEKLDVVLALRFRGLKLKDPERMTFGELIDRFDAFSQKTELVELLRVLNRERTRLLHSPLRAATNPFDDPNEKFAELVQKGRDAAAALHVFTGFAINTFFRQLIREGESSEGQQSV